MNFMKDIDCLVVYGGRNDGFGGMFEDIHLFDLLNFEWKFVNHEGTFPVGRSCHASAVIKDHLIIFGGVSEEGLISSDIWFAKIYKEDKNKRKQQEISLLNNVGLYMADIDGGI